MSTPAGYAPGRSDTNLDDCGLSSATRPHQLLGRLKRKARLHGDEGKERIRCVQLDTLRLRSTWRLPCPQHELMIVVLDAAELDATQSKKLLIQPIARGTIVAINIVATDGADVDGGASASRW
jgi:hypothetical protein